MVRQTALAAVLGLGMVVPMAAQDPGTSAAAAPAPIAQSLQRAQRHVRQGVRAGQITPEELGQLRADAQALRAKLRALRQGGTTLTPDERRGVRRDLRRLHREIAVARHNRLRRHR
ncbi:MAG TPA: hypothetical protein VLT86_09440 [Vicinamibacterales bacterium]|nr:hypothetical protein [Vicinamibacterales bacterium]